MLLIVTISICSLLTLNKFIKFGKDLLDPINQCDVVYKMSWLQRDICRTDQETIRIKEHRSNIKKILPTRLKYIYALCYCHRCYWVVHLYGNIQVFPTMSKKTLRVCKNGRILYLGEITGCKLSIISRKKCLSHVTSRSISLAITTSIPFGLNCWTDPCKFFLLFIIYAFSIISYLPNYIIHYFTFLWKIVKNNECYNWYLILIALIIRILFCRDKIPDCPMPVCNCCAHVAYSRTRIGQLNDTIRNEKYIQALRKKVTPNSVCLCFSDGCLLALAAANLGAKVFLLEQNSLSRRTMKMFVQENGLTERVRIIKSIDDLPKACEINFIFGEPYFLSSIVPWENLRFWYLVSRYPSRISRIPIMATIKALVVEFKDLQKIRAPLGVCEGFDLSSFDRLVQVCSLLVCIKCIQCIKMNTFCTVHILLKRNCFLF